MGADIHLYVERKKNTDTQWRYIRRLTYDARNYGLFGFLAQVRNYSDVPEHFPLRGVPSNCSSFVRKKLRRMEGEQHSASYILREELLNFDYGRTFKDMRELLPKPPRPCFRDGNTRGLALLKAKFLERKWDSKYEQWAERGVVTTYQEFLGPSWFEFLEGLANLGNHEVRIIFWFDN